MTDYKALLSQFESFALCRISRGYAEKRLTRYRSRTAQGILEYLKTCRKGNRCFFGVCPVCARRYRLGLLPQAEEILGQDQPCIQLSWTPPSAAFVSRKLFDFDLKDLIDRQQNALMEASPDAIAVGGIDVSLRVNSKREFGWRITTSLLIAEEHNQTTIERLSQVHRPYRPDDLSIKIIPAVSKPAALSYAVKHRIYLIQYDDENPSSSRLAFKPLPSLYTYQADLFQARWPLWDRLILHNVNPGMNPHRPTLRRYS